MNDLLIENRLQIDQIRLSRVWSKLDRVSPNRNLSKSSFIENRLNSMSEL